MRNAYYPVQKKPYQKPDVKKETPPDGTQWRCPACNRDLFGIFQDGQLHIKYRERNLLVNGVVTVECRHCRFNASIDTHNYGYPVNIIQSQDDSDLTVRKEIDATKEALDLAEKHGIDLANVEGSGKDGRILVSDVQALISVNPLT